MANFSPGGILSQQAVSDAQSDMADVTAAAQAIVSAINAARPWITSQTWTGTAAVTWMNDWDAYFGRVLNVLNEQLPPAQAAIVHKVQAQIRQNLNQGRPAPAPAHMSRGS